MNDGNVQVQVCSHQNSKHSLQFARDILKISLLSNVCSSKIISKIYWEVNVPSRLLQSTFSPKFGYQTLTYLSRITL